MADHSAASPPSHASRAGHQLATSDWLDLHFAACRPEYEAGLRAVGIAPGWIVLDAGCGGGSYLPWLAAVCGSGGSVAALDLEAGNVAAVRDRVGAWRLPCPVEVRQGDVLALPYPDASFDAVWCANISQYFPDEALGMMLAEFRRVTRPGGLIAIKEFDARPVRLAPAPVTLFWHYWEGGAPLDDMARGEMRAAELGM